MAPRSSTSSADGGIDLLTLAVTAVASAAAAYTCSKIWAPGTLASAAFTPVLVALIKEALARPAKAVTQAVPVRGVVRSASGPTGTEVREAAPAPAPPAVGAEPPERVAQQGEITYHSTGASRRWRLAVITGLLGFVAAATAFTVPELVTGKSASGGGSTTLFGGHGSGAQPTQTTTVPGRTVTAPAPTTVTQPPAVTVTAPPPVTTTVPAPAAGTTTPEPAPSGPGSSGAAPANPVPVQP
jgi:hypothetical protein